MMIIFLLNIHAQLTVRENAFYVIYFVGHSYLCVNPFIYATKFDPVKRALIGLIPCKKTAQPHGSEG